MIALSSRAVAGLVRDALVATGYGVACVDGLAESADHLTDRHVVVVLDDTSPDWLRRVSDLLQIRPTVRPVLVADIAGADEFLAAVSAGVAGFCRRGSSVAAIVRTVHAVSETGVAIPRDLVVPLVAHVRHVGGRRVDTAAGPIDVTDREWEILNLMLQRRSTKEMSELLFVSVGTVRSHVSALLRKLGAVDREDAIAMVERGRGHTSS